MATLNVDRQLQILLAEYGSLRNHIIARTTVAMQLAAIFLGALVLVIPLIATTATRALGLGLVLGTVIVTLALLWIVRNDLISECAGVCILEKRINDLAGTELLTWESRYGMIPGVAGRRPKLNAELRRLKIARNANAAPHRRTR